MQRTVLCLTLALSFASAQAAVIDLGVARSYSGFIFGNATRVMDVEGRFAVGGNLDTSGFSFGYRTPYGFTGPSLVVGGDVKLGTGQIFSGPNTNISTNDSTGPITEWEKQAGYGVFAGRNESLSVHDLRAGSVLDFAAAKQHLQGVSSGLASEAQNGQVEYKWGGIYLTGDGQSDTQVFNLQNGNVANLVLQNVKPGAQVVVNVRGNLVEFRGGQDGQLEALRDRVLFNLIDAQEVKISTFTWGSILATGANMVGTGHVEGSVIANGISAQVEIGYEPWHSPSPVPEAETWAMLLAGLGLFAGLRRRRVAK